MRGIGGSELVEDLGRSVWRSHAQAAVVMNDESSCRMRTHALQELGLLVLRRPRQLTGLKTLRLLPGRLQKRPQVSCPTVVLPVRPQ